MGLTNIAPVTLPLTNHINDQSVCVVGQIRSQDESALPTILDKIVEKNLLLD